MTENEVGGTNEHQEQHIDCEEHDQQQIQNDGSQEERILRRSSQTKNQLLIKKYIRFI